MGKRERYIATTTDGKQYNCIAATFMEVVQMLGEENLVKIEKLDFEEAQKE